MEELYSQLVMLLVIRYVTLEYFTYDLIFRIDLKSFRISINLYYIFFIRSGLGDPTSAKVLREAATAMTSVFPQSELVRFMKLTRFDKKAQVNSYESMIYV